MMTIGHTPGVDPESFVHSKYIILWACNTLSTNSHHWPFIEQARKAGAKLVVIDPVRTRTARLADWHIPIRPGTDAALALAMIHVIIKENLVDRDYIDKYTVGYDELAERASTYTPEFASAGDRHSRRRHRQAGAGIRHHAAGRGAHRRRRGAPCRRRPDRARDRLPARH